MFTIETVSEAETEALGERLGRVLREGDFVALYGALGAGKTALTRGVARGLGVTEGVCSPTYMLVMEHHGRLPLFHFDAYRLDGEDALEAIGFEEYLERSGVVVMEWPERAGDLLPSERVDVHITATDGDTRRFEFHTYDEARFHSAADPEAVAP